MCIRDSFDAIGRYRDTDNGNPVDATGELHDTVLDGMPDLVALIVDDPRTTECIAERLFAFASGHEIDGAEPEVVELVTDAFRDHKSFKSLITDLVTSDAFRYLQPGSTEAPADTEN